ncbi:MAG TPA: CDP-alcohol phosphatidyltransferase family protein, partial [Thermomonospora sp.]|nr:CDP-alcohol phosphatidyltransferase family protein [Thermomonospora sp.]
MTVALVFATDPIADLPYGTGPEAPTLLHRLLGQLASLNVPDVRVVARPDTAALLRKNPDALGPVTPTVIESESPATDLRTVARTAREAPVPVWVLPGGTVANDELLTRLAYRRSDVATAITGPSGDGDDPPVRLSGARVASAGTGFHQVTDPDGVFLGVLRVAPARRITLARVAERLAALLETPGALPGAVPKTSGVPALLLVGLVREGVRVSSLGVAPLVCRQVADAEQAQAARAAVEAVNEDKVRLNAAVKSADGFFTTFAVSTYSRYIAKAAARMRLTPNMITSLSMAIAVATAFAFAMGTRTGMVVGAVLYYFAFVFDCVDGQLARYTRRFSTFGAWLDATFDRAKEYAVFAGLAVGSTAAAAGSSVHGGDVWTLAVLAMVAQTCRHMIDFSFGARGRPPAAPLPTTPLTSPGDGLAPAATAPVRRGGPGG